MDVLDPGASPLRVLHISDIHMRPGQRLKQAWLRELAQWHPDLVINTGDNLAHPKAVSSVVQSLGDLLSIPGLFVFGSNDYFGPASRTRPNICTRAMSASMASRCRGRTCALRSPSVVGTT